MAVCHRGSAIPPIKHLHRFNNHHLQGTMRADEGAPGASRATVEVRGWRPNVPLLSAAKLTISPSASLQPRYSVLVFPLHTMPWTCQKASATVSDTMSCLSLINGMQKDKDGACLGPDDFLWVPFSTSSFLRAVRSGVLGLHNQ